jgi:peptide-methionine (S)-S-oxide reductase
MRVILLMLLLGCSETSVAADPTTAASPPSEGEAVAVFAGGCFWCMEGPFEKLKGVVSVESGYTGGPELAPTYHQVSMGQTGHVEAVRVVYEPKKVSYERLLGVFWHNIDPTQDNGQFCDKGLHYRSAVFVGSDAERSAAVKTQKGAQETLGREVVTEIREVGAFWLAEDYHQDFYKKSPTRYRSYRAGCGRDHRLQQLWGKSAGH